MKHAILMTAYKQPELINLWIEKFSGLFDFYIHIDSKSPIKPGDIHTTGKNIHIIQTYKVNWGGLNHLKAFIDLMKLAAEKKYDYYHTVSAQDWPVERNIHTLETGKNYMEWFALPAAVWEKEGGGLDRIQYYRYYDRWNYKEGGKFLIKNAFRIQKWLGIQRSLPSYPLYGGSGYLSLNHEAVSYTLSFLHTHPDFLKRLEHTFCAEEIVFQTILINSPLKDTVINNNLRYIVWPGPRILDESDYEHIKESQSLFMRKIDRIKSRELLKLLEKQANP